MVISDRYRYLFVELPRTGSTAVRHELCELYGGRPILTKHATYEDFLREASPEQRDYFVFGGIRNPADVVVSLYVRYRTDPYHKYTDPKMLARANLVERTILRREFAFIHDRDADFSSFFLRFYHLPYNTWASTSFRHCDFIMKYEDLDRDFASALRKIGIEPVRPLPVVNKTEAKERDFWAYYSPAARRRAKRVFGPYMERWGYSFPDGWGAGRVPWWNEVAFAAVTSLRTVYWRLLRPAVHGIRRARRDGLQSKGDRVAP